MRAVSSYQNKNIPAFFPRQDSSTLAKFTSGRFYLFIFWRKKKRSLQAEFGQEAKEKVEIRRGNSSDEGGRQGSCVEKGFNSRINLVHK